MAIKQRAIGTQDKEARRHALLDAAEALFLERPDRMASVDEVAQAAGLAKGTVYLYFPSKEEMLLSLHERHVAAFFGALMKLLGGAGPVGFDEIWSVTRRHIVRAPGYLALSSRCFGLMDRDIPTETAIAFKIRVGQALSDAGAGLERHFRDLGPGAGVMLLQHSYGLIVGLWQLMHPIERFGDAVNRAELKMFRGDYERELEFALRALWSGTMAAGTRKAGIAKRKSR
jgi:AcrR family transcriptional regulator